MPISLPELPYSVAALEPHISAATLSIHHGKHHRAYVDKANALIGDAGGTLEEIILRAAGDSSIMTADVVSPDTPVAEIATLLEKRGIKRVPVLQGGRLAGIVSRSNLVQALAAKGRLMNAGDSSDGAIRVQLSAELERQPWWRPTTSNVIVTDGVVHYFGMIDSEDPRQRQAARVAAENVPGVRAVEDHRVPISAVAWSV